MEHGVETASKAEEIQAYNVQMEAICGVEKNNTECTKNNIHKAEQPAVLHTV